MRQALQSVIAQTYPQWQLIIVDDASTDGSVRVIQDFLQEYTAHYDIRFIARSHNAGNCTAFNQGLALAQGEYVIDFATDDVLLPQRLAAQVQFFETCPAHVGIIYGNAELIDERNKFLGLHDRHSLPSGDVFEAVLARYFICTASMMVRRSVLEDLGGYDTSLTYEDFDFWVRSARQWHYAYQPAILTQRRIVQQSHSAGFTRLDSLPYHASTLRVCQKAATLCHTDTEYQALGRRLAYQLRQAYLMEHLDIVEQYLALWESLPYTQPNAASRVWAALAHHKVRLGRYYRGLMRWRKRR